MNLSVLGLSARDAHVFDLFMQRALGSWHWHHLAASRDADLGDAKLLVLDLAAHGWAQATDLALAQMRRLVGERFAVLLVSGQDRTWAEMPAAQNKSHWIWLAKPYGTEQMRDALKRAAVLQVAKVTKPAAKVVPVATALPDLPLAVTTAPQVSQVPPKPIPAASRLAVTELASYLADAPVERFALLRHLVQKLMQGEPFELRFTVQNSLIVHPQDAWAATNTPVPVIARVCDSTALASAVTFREMDAPEALARAHRLGMQLRDLDSFLFDISSALLAFRGTLINAIGPQGSRPPHSPT